MFYMQEVLTGGNFSLCRYIYNPISASVVTDHKTTSGNVIGRL